MAKGTPPERGHKPHMTFRRGYRCWGCGRALPDGYPFAVCYTCWERRAPESQSADDRRLWRVTVHYYVRDAAAGLAMARAEESAEGAMMREGGDIEAVRVVKAKLAKTGEVARVAVDAKTYGPGATKAAPRPENP